MTVLLLGDGNLVVLQDQHPDLLPAAFDTDGMHLSRAAYEALVPRIAEALDTVSW